jgi:hypothetical protein
LSSEIVMSTNLLYYSTNSYLSYWLSSKYYGGIFYIWCSPVFDPRSLNSLDHHNTIPNSSSPCDIYRTLDSAVKTSDKGDVKIKENRAGLKRGALNFYERELITLEEFKRINKIIDEAPINDFRPLLYIIPNSLEQKRIEVVPLEETASYLSTEYRVKDLKREEFDIISFK